MKIVNFSNVEELVFYDKNLQNILPDHMFGFFEQWRLSKRLPFLRNVGKQALLDFINSLNEEDINILELYFGEKIIVQKLNYNIVENLKIPLNNAQICEALCEIQSFNYFSTWRDEQFLYISFWR
jgi:hypothetical protein